MVTYRREKINQNRFRGSEDCSPSSAARGLAPELTPVPLVVGNSASEVTLASLIDFAFEYLQNAKIGQMRDFF